MPLDIAAGILLSLLTASMYELEATIPLIMFGIVSTLLPDIDAVNVLLKKISNKEQPGIKNHHHRSWVHYPIIYLPAVAALYFFFGPVWSTLFALGVYFHFIHDTIGLGWGIVWFWPFSKRRFRFFPDRRGRFSPPFFMSWMPEEETALIAKNHNPNWVRDFYLRPNIIAYTEYSVLLISLTILYFYFS